ncbi:hypothetical protein AYI68_g7721 [Smittium mucronatum]|uniref:Uncharacterized protein n=1 Tax=Smittium mucronatum TaxID=133383 RepID=A0A1R0GMY3_9FUNG|nr:hypothetical protein AYI68_g7721 [Smittium mucronatum]
MVDNFFQTNTKFKSSKDPVFPFYSEKDKSSLKMSSNVSSNIEIIYSPPVTHPENLEISEKNLTDSAYQFEVSLEIENINKDSNSLIEDDAPSTQNKVTSFYTNNNIINFNRFSGNKTPSSGVILPLTEKVRTQKNKTPNDSFDHEKKKTKKLNSSQISSFDFLNSPKESIIGDSINLCSESNKNDNKDPFSLNINTDNSNSTQNEESFLTFNDNIAFTEFPILDNSTRENYHFTKASDNNLFEDQDSSLKIKDNLPLISSENFPPSSKDPPPSILSSTYKHPSLPIIYMNHSNSWRLLIGSNSTSVDVKLENPIDSQAQRALFGTDIKQLMVFLQSDLQIPENHRIILNFPTIDLVLNQSDLECSSISLKKLYKYHSELNSMNKSGSVVMEWLNPDSSESGPKYSQFYFTVKSEVYAKYTIMMLDELLDEAGEISSDSTSENHLLVTSETSCNIGRPDIPFKYSLQAEKQPPLDDIQNSLTDKSSTKIPSVEKDHTKEISSQKDQTIETPSKFNQTKEVDHLLPSDDIKVSLNNNQNHSYSRFDTNSLNSNYSKAQSTEISSDLFSPNISCVASTAEAFNITKIKQLTDTQSELFSHQLDPFPKFLGTDDILEQPKTDSNSDHGSLIEVHSENPISGKNSGNINFEVYYNPISKPKEYLDSFNFIVNNSTNNLENPISRKDNENASKSHSIPKISTKGDIDFNIESSFSTFTGNSDVGSHVVCDLYNNLNKSFGELSDSYLRNHVENKDNINLIPQLKNESFDGSSYPEQPSSSLNFSSTLSETKDNRDSSLKFEYPLDQDSFKTEKISLENHDNFFKSEHPSTSELSVSTKKSAVFLDIDDNDLIEFDDDDLDS